MCVTAAAIAALLLVRRSIARRALRLRLGTGAPACGGARLVLLATPRDEPQAAVAGRNAARALSASTGRAQVATVVLLPSDGLGEAAMVLACERGWRAAGGSDARPDADAHRRRHLRIVRTADFAGGTAEAAHASTVGADFVGLVGSEADVGAADAWDEGLLRDARAGGGVLSCTPACGEGRRGSPPVWLACCGFDVDDGSPLVEARSFAVRPHAIAAAVFADPDWCFGDRDGVLRLGLAELAASGGKVGVRTARASLRAHSRGMRVWLPTTSPWFAKGGGTTPPAAGGDDWDAAMRELGSLDGIAADEEARVAAWEEHASLSVRDGRAGRVALTGVFADADADELAARFGDLTTARAAMVGAH